MTKEKTNAMPTNKRLVSRNNYPTTVKIGSYELVIPSKGSSLLADSWSVDKSKLPTGIELVTEGG